MIARRGTRRVAGPLGPDMVDPMSIPPTDADGLAKFLAGDVDTFFGDPGGLRISAAPAKNDAGISTSPPPNSNDNPPPHQHPVCVRIAELRLSLEAPAPGDQIRPPSGKSRVLLAGSALLLAAVIALGRHRSRPGRCGSCEDRPCGEPASSQGRRTVPGGRRAEPSERGNGRPGLGHGNDGQGPCGAFPVDGFARRRVWGTSGDAPMVRRAPIGHQSRTVAQACCLAQPAAATGSAFAVAPAAQPRYRGRVFRFAADTGPTIGARLRLPKVAGSSVRLLPLKHTRNQAAAGKRGSCGTRPPRCPHADPSAAQGPKVRRLFAGGKRIRTIGPARRKAVVPKREHPRAASRSLPGRPQTISAADDRQAAGDQIIATRLRRRSCR